MIQIRRFLNLLWLFQCFFAFTLSNNEFNKGMFIFDSWANNFLACYSLLYFHYRWFFTWCWSGRFIGFAIIFFLFSSLFFWHFNDIKENEVLLLIIGKYHFISLRFLINFAKFYSLRFVTCYGCSLWYIIFTFRCS